MSLVGKSKFIQYCTRFSAVIIHRIQFLYNNGLAMKSPTLSIIRLFIHSFKFNSTLKAHAVEYNGKKHINSRN